MHHDDFNFEPIRGLPGKLPEGEEILWQGAPNPWRLAVEALALRWVAGYFAVLAVWRIGVSSAEFPLAEALVHAVPLVVLGLAACLILYGIAWVQARSTVYTLTNRRVALRIGAALTMTLNIPFVKIGSAHLDRRGGGFGTIAFETLGGARISYLMTWPHVRPLVFRTQPALRCIPDVDRVAEIFAEAAEARVNEPQVAPARAAVAAE